MSANLRRCAALGLVGTLSLAPVFLTAQNAAAEEAAPKVLLMLDASGSMNEKDSSGVTKMEAAKKSLTNAVEALPANAQVGLRVYGATQQGGKPTPEACSDTQLVLPVGPLDKAKLTESINGFQAKGETPIAHSLAQGAKDLGEEGKRHIILVSDGQESCVPDPCPEVRKLMTQGISMQIDTVGFGVDDKARQQLKCIAEAGNGTYYDAKDASSLESSLKRLNVRAARAFTVQGTPVTGTPKPEHAPLLAPGQYTDVAPVSEQDSTRRYYRIKRTWPDSTLRFSVVSRMPHGDRGSSGSSGYWSLSLETADGKQCHSETITMSDDVGIGQVLAATLTALPLDPRENKPEEDAKICGSATDFVVQVRRSSGSKGEVPVELRVIEEPPVVDAAKLPSGVSTVPSGVSDLSSPASGTPQAVVGGASFNDAAAIKPGTYETELIPGEMVFFKAPIQYGQSAVFAIDGPDPAFAGLASLPADSKIAVAGNVYAPDFSQMDSQNTLDWAAKYTYEEGKLKLSSSVDINAIPEVQFRNRWDSPEMFSSRSRGFSMAGDYYFGVGLGTQEHLAGQPVPVRFSLGVYGDSAPAPSPAVDVPVADPSSGSGATAAPAGPLGLPVETGTLALVGGGLVLSGTLGGLGYLWWRRSR